MFLIMLFPKLLEPNMHFTLQVNSHVFIILSIPANHEHRDVLRVITSVRS